LSEGFIPTVKRLLLLILEIVVLLAALTLIVATAVVADRLDNQVGSVVVLLGGLIPAVGSVIWLRWKDRKWKLRLDAEGFLAFRARMKAHPKRTRRIEKLRRWSLWVPSFVAAFALFFLPINSQLISFRTRFLAHWNFSVPFNWMVIKSSGGRFVWAFFTNSGPARYGITPNWFREPSPASVTLSFGDPGDRFGWRKPEYEKETGRFTHQDKLVIMIGGREMDCWEYPRRDWEPIGWEEILCATRPNGRDFNLRVSFFGDKRDKGSFYRVLATAKPTTE